MKYLLTGTTGFIGRTLFERLNTTDNQIMCIGREWQTNSKLTDDIIRFKPDHIIHCAAEIKNYSNCFVSNVVMTQWLLEHTHDVDYKSFVNLGSSSEYGQLSRPATEADLTSPRTIYESTKAAATMLCQGYARHYNKPVATVRPFSVYGGYEPVSRLIPTLFRNFESNVTTSISDGVHDFIHIDDFLDGLLLVCHSEGELVTGDIVHLGSGTQHTNVEVFNTVKKLFNSELEYKKINGMVNPYDSMIWVADTSYARYKYKFTPRYNLETGLKQIYETRNKNARK